MPIIEDRIWFDINQKDRFNLMKKKKQFVFSDKHWDISVDY